MCWHVMLLAHYPPARIKFWSVVQIWHCMRFLVVFCLFSCSFFTHASEKPVITIVASENHDYINSDGTGLHWKLLDKVLSPHFEIVKITTHWQKARQLLESGNADLWLTTTNIDQSGLLRSTEHVDVSYPVYAYFADDNIAVNSTDDLQKYTVAIQRNSPLNSLLSNQTNTYHVDSIYQVDRLILRGRVQIALSYSYNMHLVTPKGQLKFKEIYPPTKLYMFAQNSNKQRRLLDEFDNYFKQAIETGQLENLFPNRLMYRHARYDDKSDARNIHWNLVPKLYNLNSKRLDVLEREVKFSDYLMRQIPNFQFIYSAHSYSAFQHLSPQVNTLCSILFMQESLSETHYVYSHPMYVFIKPRLFFTKKGLKSFKEQLGNIERPVSITQLLNQNTSLRIAISNNSNIYRDLKSIVSNERLKDFYIVDDLNYKNMVDMLITGRVDAIIAWPSMVAELLEKSGDLELLRSLSIAEAIGKNIFSYVGCTNSLDGHHFINNVDKILENKKHRSLLFSNDSILLDKDSKILFKQLLDAELDKKD